MSKTTSASLVVILSLLSACSEKTASAPPPAAHAPAPLQPLAAPTTADKVDAILLKAVFGKQYRPASRDVLASLPDPDNRAETGSYLVTAAGNTVLATGETVLVANAEEANEAGESLSGHVSSGLLNVYLLRQTAGKWQIIKHHENVAGLGSNGHIGQVIWTTLAKDKPGLALVHGGTWQGSSIANLALFDVRGASVHNLAPDAITISSDNEGACDPEGTTECWSVSGKWRFAAPRTPAAYDDLLIDFTGEKSHRTEDAKGDLAGPRVVEKISGAARYAYDGKQYKLVEGENIVPGI